MYLLFIRNRFLISLLSSLFLVAITAVFWVFFGDFFQSLDLSFQGLLYRNQDIARATRTDSLVVVAIDNKTLQDTSKGGLGRWQDFRRTYYARVIDNLTRAGAVTIGINMLFSESSSDATDDTILAESL